MNKQNLIIVQGIYGTIRDAKDALREFVHKHESCVIRVDYNRQYVQIGDLEFYFISMGQEETWCKGRTYAYKNELYHSGIKVKER